MTDEELGTTC